ncbi:MAG: hypothetical protein H7338_03425, partial [Candidatus Sericytochromatia bacterium]|nr:hypothetical protein [Candidatus Sericytochromatia bacterium]
MPYLLLTVSLQTDFVAPLAAGERLPNTLHIGRAESRRLGLDDIAACSALPASSSHIHHREALEHLASGLGVTVIDSIPEFHAWLGIRRDGAVVTLRGRLAPDVTTEGDTTLGDEVRRLVEYLFRDCASVRLKPLSGGFSGSQVFMTESVDRRGLQEIPFVVKVDAHAKIAKERAAVESIENGLGSVSPRMAEFADLETLGAIKYQFATMHGGVVLTLKKAFQAAPDVAAVQALFQQDPAGFYAALPDWLGREAEEVPCGWIHGHLNLANILLDETGNTWMIDYFWTRVGHALQDIAKLEND